jgi:hypothetical protein
MINMTAVLLPTASATSQYNFLEGQPRKGRREEDWIGSEVSTNSAARSPGELHGRKDPSVTAWPLGKLIEDKADLAQCQNRIKDAHASS